LSGAEWNESCSNPWPKAGRDEITEFDLSQVSDNMCNQEEIIQIDAKIHMLIFNTFRDKLLLLLQNEKYIDDILVHAYVEYYTELL
jgi:hypothetical protein